MSVRLNGTKPWDDPEVVASVVQNIRRVIRLNKLEAFLDIGQEVVEQFYGGLEGYRSLGTRRTSLRKLASHPDLPMSKSQLYNAVSIYELSGRAEILFQSEHSLSVSHCVEVLPAPPDRQPDLLVQADRERWSVRRLRQEVDRYRDRAGVGGRPSLLPVVKVASALRKYLDDSGEDPFAGIERMDNLAEAQDVYAALRRARERLEFGEQRLLKHLQILGLGSQGEGARDSRPSPREFEFAPVN